jgi:hypothetical protein
VALENQRLERGKMLENGDDGYVHPSLQRRVLRQKCGRCAGMRYYTDDEPSSVGSAVEN